jgi:hypothetical protein
MPRVAIELPDSCSASINGSKIIIECGDYTALANLLSRIKGVNLLEAVLDDLNGS